MSNKITTLFNVLSTPVGASATYPTPNLYAYTSFYLSGIVNSTTAGTLYIDFTNLVLPGGAGQPGAQEQPDWSQPYGSTPAQAVAAGVGALIPAVVPGARWARVRFVNGASAGSLTLSVIGLEDA